MEKQPVVYITTNKRNGTLYTGVTSNIVQRSYQHKQKLIEGFSKKYSCIQLVYYEVFHRMIDAIEREKQIKSKNRKQKLALIEGKNPEWKDYSDEFTQ
jgi:putative endonuclease